MSTTRTSQIYDLKQMGLVNSMNLKFSENQKLVIKSSEF